MKFCKWRVEAFAVLEDGTIEQQNVFVETNSENKAKLFEKAKDRIAQIIGKYRRITICWFELVENRIVENKKQSKYQKFCNLIEQKVSRSQIQKRLSIPFSELRLFERYYQGKTRKLTFSKYHELTERFSDEQIRKHYEIPRCEFNKFLKARKLAKN